MWVKKIGVHHLRINKPFINIPFTVSRLAPTDQCAEKRQTMKEVGKEEMSVKKKRAPEMTGAASETTYTRYRSL